MKNKQINKYILAMSPVFISTWMKSVPIVCLYIYEKLPCHFTQMLYFSLKGQPIFPLFRFRKFWYLNVIGKKDIVLINIDMLRNTVLFNLDW